MIPRCVQIINSYLPDGWETPPSFGVRPFVKLRTGRSSIVESGNERWSMPSQTVPHHRASDGY